MALGQPVWNARLVMASISSVQGDAVFEGSAEVVRELVGMPAGNEGGDGEDAAVTCG